MFEFDALCREYEKLSYDERRTMLTELADDILPALKLVANGTESFETLVMASCAADGKLSIEEYSLVKDATGLDFSFNRVAAEIKAMNVKDIQEAANTVADFLGKISADIKSEVVSFCLCICSADSRVTLKEKKFIKKLLA